MSTRRIGHAGTLDPLATGVLVVCVGRMTSAVEFLVGCDKTYRASIRFGVCSETFDAEGPLERTGAPVPKDVAPAVAQLERLRAEYLQTPPRHSAKKIGGTSAWKLARRGEEVVLKAVRVHVRSFEVLGWAGEGVEGGAATALLDLRVVVSSGFYVRSLAHDLGEALGCGAYLAGLRREAVGDVTLGDCLRADLADGDAVRAAVAGHALGPDDVFAALPAIDLDADTARRIDLGQLNDLVAPDGAPAATPGAHAGARHWLRGPDGVRAIAVADDRRRLHIAKRFSEAQRAWDAWRAVAA